MGIGLLRAAKISWHWHKLSKLCNAHEYDEALSLLGKYELPLEYQAKARVISDTTPADIWCGYCY